MTYEEQQLFIERFNKIDEQYSFNNPPKMTIDRPHENDSISSLIFLYSKLKASKKPNKYFIHALDEVLLIGDFDDFEQFSDDDIKNAIALGIGLNTENNCFSIYASA